MKELKVITYQPGFFNQWNAFIEHSKNGTFLFHRNFIEYHHDRFEDFSLMVFDNDLLVAVFPANRVGETIYSHQGLTYGGLILQKNIKAFEVYSIYNLIIQFLKKTNFKELIVKPVLNFYCSEPTNELDCFLIKDGATLYRKDLNLAIDFKKELSISKSKLKHFRKEDKSQIEIKVETNFEGFWNTVLIPRLQEKYQVNPVHTLDEITFLHNHFPNNIKQYNAYYNDELVAGITLFIFNNVIKSQYGATTLNGEKIRALDYLFINLINEYKESFDFFDMGTVTEHSELGFNQGLLNQKQELGCAVYSQDFYKLKL